MSLMSNYSAFLISVFSDNGLLNLKETYSYDIKFCCDIDVLLQMINAKLSEIDEDNIPPPLYVNSNNDKTE